MAVKSVVDIEVNDASFKDFVALFNKYNTALGKMPGVWNSTTDSIQTTGKKTDSLTAAVEALSKILGKQITEQSKMRKEIDNTNKSMTDLGKSATRVYDTIRGITTSMLKWGTITSAFGLVSGATGFLGFEALARAASSSRTSAMSVGVSPSEFQAANIAYARIPNAGGMLSRLADIQQDPVRTAILANRLGISQSDVVNKSPFELMQQVVPALHERYQTLPKGAQLQWAESLGLSDIADTSQLRTIGGMSGAELQELQSSAARYKQTLGANADVDKQYQDFISKFDEMWQEIKNRLTTGLVGLAEPLGKLTTAFGRLLESGLESKAFSEGITAFAKAINSFADYMKTDKFSKDVESLWNSVEGVAIGLSRLAKKLGWMFPEESDPEKPPGGFYGMHGMVGHFEQGFAPTALSAFPPPEPPDEYPGEWKWYKNWKYKHGGAGKPITDELDPLFMSLERQKSLPPGLLHKIMMMESGGDPTSYNGKAMGLMQFTPETSRDYGLTNPYDPVESANASARYWSDLLAMFGGDIEKASAAYNWGPQNVKNAIARANQSHTDWITDPQIPQETRNYMQQVGRTFGTDHFAAQPGQGVKIAIYNATGGNYTDIVASLSATGVPQ